MDNSVSRRNSFAPNPEALQLADFESNENVEQLKAAGFNPDEPNITVVHRPHSFALSHSNAADKPAAELMLAITPSAAARDGQRGPDSNQHDNNPRNDSEPNRSHIKLSSIGIAPPAQEQEQEQEQLSLDDDSESKMSSSVAINIRDRKSPPEDSENRARRTRVDGYLNAARIHALRETQDSLREISMCKNFKYFMGGGIGYFLSLYAAVLIADELWPSDGDSGSPKSSFAIGATIGFLTIAGAVAGACASRLLPSRLLPSPSVRDRLGDLNIGIAQAESTWTERRGQVVDQVLQHSHLPAREANLVADYRSYDLPELLRQEHPLLRQYIPEDFYATGRP